MGSGNSGIIIDITGEANLNFHGIPLNAIKKAAFHSKLNTLAAILKMTVNNVTYDFQKTAQNGAVIFGANYGLWDFVAPDGRFDFSNYDELTVGEALYDMEQVLMVAPVPAWDTFIRWLNANMTNFEIDTSGLTACFVTPIDDTSSRVQGNIIDLEHLTDCVSFIQELEHAVAPIAANPLSTYVTSDTSFGFTIICQGFNEDIGAEADLFGFSFRFRQ
jgi:hypothetical protein